MGAETSRPPHAVQVPLAVFRLPAPRRNVPPARRTDPGPRVHFCTPLVPEGVDGPNGATTKELAQHVDRSHRLTIT